MNKYLTKTPNGKGKDKKRKSVIDPGTGVTQNSDKRHGRVENKPEKVQERPEGHAPPLEKITDHGDAAFQAV